MTGDQSFSKRFGHVAGEKKITIREGAPIEFRSMLLWLAREKFRLTPSTIRHITCDALRIFPDRKNRHEEDIWQEVQQFLFNCIWFNVYDITEAVYVHFQHSDVRLITSASGFTSRVDTAALFEADVNAAFREFGIGWQMKDGLVQNRSDDASEAALTAATEALKEAGLPTAESELKEALHDLSRRPEPDLSGAVTHAMGALECVARVATGDAKSTLGQLKTKLTGIVPAPLDEAVVKVWGYSSEEARHVKEGRILTREEAQLVVGLAASISTYLAQKLKQ